MKALAEPELIAISLMTLEGLAITDEGQLLVLESSLHRRAAIDFETGEVIVVVENLALGMPAWPGLLNSVAVDSAGTIYVTGDIDNVIYRITSAQ